MYCIFTFHSRFYWIKSCIERMYKFSPMMMMVGCLRSQLYFYDIISFFPWFNCILLQRMQPYVASLSTSMLFLRQPLLKVRLLLPTQHYSHFFRCPYTLVASVINIYNIKQHIKNISILNIFIMINFFFKKSLTYYSCYSRCLYLY